MNNRKDKKREVLIRELKQLKKRKKSKISTKINE